MEKIKQIDANVPMTLICSKACEDLKNILDGVQKEHGLPSDLMVMICRDILAYFERKRANDYCNALIANGAKMDALRKENDALKQLQGFFEGVADDHTET